MDSDENGRNKRRRLKTSRFEFEMLENEEQKLIQQAIKNSQRDKKRVEYTVPEAPTYYPTVEEFKDPLGYIKKVSSSVGRYYGIFKIVPPEGWKPTCQVKFDNPNTFATKLQPIHTLQEGLGFDDGRRYNISSYRAMSDEFWNSWKEKYYADTEMTRENLEKDYWLTVETGSRTVEVEYANDIDVAAYQSGFLRNTQSDTTGVESVDTKDMFSDAYYARTGWNLLNLPSAQGSLLKHLKTPINGVNVPWLYIGMLFSSFCWHNEDNYLYSINYSHYGDIKQWYGVPGDEAKNFETVMKNFLLESFKDTPDLLHHMTTQISPSLLMANGIHVYQVKHEPGTFVITCPKSYHGGFSYGFNIGEAVNFALDDWIAAGGEAEERYRTFARPSVFSHHRLLFTLLLNRRELSSSVLNVLAQELLKVIDEEINSRPAIYATGVRDISKELKLPRNDFRCINQEAADYDEMRCCYICNYTCVLSAVACECDQAKVTCLRHAPALCKCVKNKNYLLEWEGTSELRKLRDELSVLARSIVSAK